MPPLETPHTCDMCGSEILINIGKAGRWNKVLHTGGPHQEPRLMGLGWAFYRCPMCQFEGPWRINYTGGSRELNLQYTQLLGECKEKHLQRKQQGDLIEKLNGELDATTALEGLPGRDKSIEAALEAATAPLYEKIQELEGLLKKRKGGRPPLSAEEKENRKQDRLAKKREREAARRRETADKKEN